MIRIQVSPQPLWRQRCGMALIGFGWAAALASYLPAGFARPSYELAGVFLPAALLTLGQFALATGIALYMCGHFAQGFSALDRFFESILQRTHQPAAPPPAPHPAELRQAEPRQAEPRRPEPRRIEIRQPESRQAAPPQAEPAAPPHLAGEGFIGERPYILYSDGSIDVETLLGPRRFDSMEAARAFVGPADVRRAGAPKLAAVAHRG